jgi:flagellar hook-length control protein FliK
VADTGLLTPEAPVAEQMNYWVSRDVQNAQLRLDGFGADGVEVNITLQGKEAQVDFRTDMPEAREALEGASAQLKDMLSREGLVLAGVSVGTSAQGQGQTHAQQRRDQALARQARVTAAVAANDSSALQPLAVPQRASGRALDLFV